MSSSDLWIPPTAQRGNFRKADPPKLGEAFGHWAGTDNQYLQLPGGGVIQFDLSKLTLADFRSMRDHYQINASLAVLSFMMHRLDWRIECKDQRIADACEENMRDVWTRLIRSLSQAYWAGYAPSVIQWENDLENRTIVATKFKDLVPEDCRVNWKEVNGYAPPGEIPPKLKVYDGIKQRGLRHPIPVENTLWYPLLMENGDHYGRKLLRPAFPSWFFSILIHLFVNRYFERFGEPLPIGRADYEAEVNLNGSMVDGRTAMETLLSMIRSRSVVVLPSDRTQVGDGRYEYDFNIEYLESQMRGADFERYLSRLDEEMSIGLFTPVLLLRTSEVGSYNLGVGHMQMYMWMLNALAGDLKEYIDRFLLRRMVDYKFSPNAPDAKWVPRAMGKESVETVRAILQELVRSGQAKPNLEELGQIAGLTLTEVRQVTEPEPDDDPQDDDRVGRPERNPGGGRRTPRGVGEPRATGKEISARIRKQVEKAYQNRTFGRDFFPSLGYRGRFQKSLQAEGADPGTANRLTNDFYARMETWMADVVALGIEEFPTPDDFMNLFDKMFTTEVDRLAA